MKYLLIAITGCLVACGIKQKAAPAELVPVEVTIVKHQPYCGGAAPTPEMEKGTFTPIENQVFIFKKGLSNNQSEPIFKEIKTNENGMFSLQVPVGDYVLLHPSKMQSFDQFKSIHQPKSTYVEYLGDDCLQRVYDAPDFILRIQKDTVIQLIQKSSCYTGTTPCVRYTGPQAP